MPNFARGSKPWLATSLAVALVAIVLAVLMPSVWLYAVAGLAAFVFLFFLQFFRDPERTVSEGIVSPADGRVVRQDHVVDPHIGAADRICIFMSPKDVHVNRFPMDGTVVSVTHVPGGHIPAFKKDSDRNERVETILDTQLGRVKVIQIAGTVARRIVPYIQGGETAVKGERFGLIRLGSRCDLLVPPGSVSWTVGIGQQVYGSKTTIGTIVATPPTPKLAKQAKAVQAATASKPPKASKAKASGKAGKAAKPAASSKPKSAKKGAKR